MPLKDALISTPHAITMRGKIAGLVVQRVAPGTGNATYSPDRSIQVRVQPQINDRKSPAQLARRALLTAGNSEWLAMAEPDRQAWRDLAAGGHTSGYALHMRAYLLTEHALPATIWDDGETNWDDGTTSWDWAASTSWDDGATSWDDDATTWY